MLTRHSAVHWRMDANTTSIDVKIELTGDASKITIHGTTVVSDVRCMAADAAADIYTFESV